MKALILAGGAGTRLRPLTHTSAKQLLPVANKPIIFYGIEAIAEAGVKEFAIIVGDTADDVMKEVGDGSRWGVKITYIRQEAPLGLAHAVKISKDFMQRDPFIMFLGDNLLKEGIPEFVSKFKTNKPNALILLTKVPNPQQFGVAELDASGGVSRLVEKPKHPKSDLALVGIYLFDSSIFKAVDAIKPSKRGELEITDAIQWLLDNGYSVEPHMVSGWWKDTGKPEDLIDANKLVLEMIKKNDISGTVSKDSVLTGNVILGKGSKISGSRIQGPVSIADNSKILGSQIGPFVSIGENSSVDNCSVDNSIVMEECRIKDVKKKISSSILGRGVNICGSCGAHSFVIGDRSDISLA
jgi:glucose-1-phosphate thymidylyltransferase